MDDLRPYYGYKPGGMICGPNPWWLEYPYAVVYRLHQSVASGLRASDAISPYSWGSWLPCYPSRRWL